VKVQILFKDSIHHGKAAANRVINYAIGLQQNGVDVEILMPFGFWAIENITFNKTGTFRSIPYRYAWHLPFHPKKKYQLPLSFLVLKTSILVGNIYFILQFFRNSKKVSHVLFYKFNTLYTLVLLLVNTKKITVCELNEIPYFNQKGRRKIINRFLREKTVFKMFDSFIVISENLNQYISTIKKNSAKVLKVPVLCEPIYWQDDNKDRFTNDPYIIHVGDMAGEEKDGIFNMIEVFALVSKMLNFPLKFIITSSLNQSPVKDKIKKIIEDYNLINYIQFTGYINKDEMQNLQRNAALAIIIKPDNEQNRYCFPTKLAEYLMNAIPVFAMGVGEMNQFLYDGINAFIVPKADTLALAERIVDSFKNPNLLREIATNGRKTALHDFNCEVQGKRLSDFFGELIKP